MTEEYFPGFWVAEVIGANFKNAVQAVTIVRESEFGLNKNWEGLPRRVIGTAAVISSDNDTSAAWLRRMAVVPEFQKHGIASALIDEIVAFCRKKG